MFEKQMERSESMFLCNQQSSSCARDAEDGCEELDQMIDDAAERVRKHYRIEDIGDPGISTDVCFFVSPDHSLDHTSCFRTT